MKFTDTLGALSNSILSRAAYNSNELSERVPKINTARQELIDVQHFMWARLCAPEYSAIYILDRSIYIVEYSGAHSGRIIKSTHISLVKPSVIKCFMGNVFLY